MTVRTHSTSIFLILLTFEMTLVGSTLAAASPRCTNQLRSSRSLVAKEKYLTELGYPPSIAQRIAKHKPEWIARYHSHFESHPDDPSNLKHWLVQYRGLDISSLAEYNPRNTRVYDPLANPGEVWMGALSEASRGRVVLAFANVPFLIINSSNEGIALCRKQWRDDRLLLIKAGIKKPGAEHKHKFKITEDDYTWSTYEELVERGDLRPLR